jgi:hypothetical protein
LPGKDLPSAPLFLGILGISRGTEEDLELLGEALIKVDDDIEALLISWGDFEN